MEVVSTGLKQEPLPDVPQRDLCLCDDERQIYLIARSVGNQNRASKALAGLSDIFEQLTPSIYDQTRKEGLAPEVRRRIALTGLEKVLRSASGAIHSLSLAQGDLSDMAVTATVVMLIDQAALIAHVGHNMAFHIRDSVAQQLTTFHTVSPSRSQQGDFGPVDPADPNIDYVVTRALGLFPFVEVDTAWHGVLPGDRILLTNSTVMRYLKADEVAKIVSSMPSNRAVQGIFSLVEQRGCRQHGAAIVLEASAPEIAATAPVGMNSDAGRRIAILRGLPFFQHLTFHEMLSLLLIVYEHTFRPGDTIVAEGSAGQHLFVIVSGTVSVTSKDVELTKLGPGREFGSLSFVDGVRRSATVKAETDVIALTIDRDDFLTQLAPRDPHLATRLTWSLLQHVAGRLREITDDYVGATSGRLKAAK